ncbi:hypothetical protein CDEST_15145 [Colletotrichum destructivum]|uniref:Uncharacterized protein n=1 Tax=Colletotrichum destructivum TaxID=34406 RepID=A0AAX4J3P3_9PEZI|nr:hypothetical protein CDEST_15145 [Colletotrichum destructivum]
MSATNQIQRKPSGRNPLRTVWRETYEVWDGVCHGVGKAYFKITGRWLACFTVAVSQVDPGLKLEEPGNVFQYRCYGPQRLRQTSISRDTTKTRGQTTDGRYTG